MNTEQQKAVVRRFVDDVISRGNLSLIDELLAADYRYHGPGMDVGREGLKGVFTMLRGAFPDWHEQIEDLVAEGDRVVFRVTGRGTHRGEFMGLPPTGRTVIITGIDIVRFHGNRIAEHWAAFDQLGMMKQLGAIPG